MTRSEKFLLASLSALLLLAVVVGVVLLPSLLRPDARSPEAGAPDRESEGADRAPSAGAADSGRASLKGAAESGEGEATGGPVPRAGSISGRAVDRRTGTSVPGVAVFLEEGASRGFADFMTARAPSVPGRGPLRTDADDAGSFVLGSVPEGTYRVFAFADAWYCPEPRVVTVRAGEPVDGIEVGLERAGAVSGRVVDRFGGGIAGAAVATAPGFESLVLLQESRNLGRAGRRGGVTDDSGGFVVAGLPEGRGYRITATKDGYARGAIASVRVASGEETRGVEVVLLRGSRLAGVVLGPDGAPVAGAEARLHPASAEEWFPPEGGQPSRKTGDDGRFVFESVAPGRTRLSVEAAAFVAWTSDSIEIEDEKESPLVTVNLESGLAISGRVADVAGAPVAGATVTAAAASTPSRRRVSPASRQATTAENGEYAIRGLESGLHSVSAAAPGFEPDRKSGVAAGTDGADFALKRSAGVSGQVLTPAGPPIAARFTVRASAPSAPSFGFGSRFAGGATRESSFTDEDGRFTLGDVRSGKVRLVASAEGFADSEPVDVEVPPEGTVAGVLLFLKEAGGISGVVLRTSDRAPVAGARVRDGQPEAGFGEFFASAFAPGSVETAADGTFALRDLEPGTHAITVSSPEYPTVVVEDVAVTPGIPVGPVEVLLASGGGVYGTVFGQNGAPEPGAIVAIMAGLMNVQRTAIADETGYYEIRGLKPGPYSLLKTKMAPGSPFEGMRTVAVTIVEGEMIRVDVGEAVGGCRVFGTVTDALTPLDGATVTSFLRDGPSGESAPSGLHFRTARTDRNGLYEIANLPSGDYRFQVQPPSGGGRPFLADSFVPAEPEFRIDFAVPRGGFSGRVTDAATGEAIAGIDVRASLSESERRGDFSDMAARDLGSASTDEDGRYELDRLSPGIYRAEAGGGGVLPGAGEALRYGRDVREAIRVEEGRVVRGVDFALETPGSLAALVTKPDGKEPVPAAFLHLRDQNGNEVSGFGNVTNAEGRVRIGGLKPGAYRVTVLTLEWAPLIRDGVKIASASETSEEFRLGRGGEIRLTVVDGSSGRGVAGARAELLDEKGEAVLKDARLLAIFTAPGRDRTDEKGALDVRHVPPGAYRLRVIAPDRRPAERPISVAEGDALEVEIELD